MNERTISTRTAFSGRLLEVDVVEVELASGHRSVREIVRHPGAAVVLALVEDGRFVFVRQYRKAVGRVLLETVAGTLNPGEDPAACARRELTEETGHVADGLVHLGDCFPAPGYTEEKLHIYFARTTGGCGETSPDEDEHVETDYLSSDEIESLIDDGALVDAKTLAAWLLYQRRMVAS